MEYSILEGLEQCDPSVDVKKKYLNDKYICNKFILLLFKLLLSKASW